MRNIFIDTSSLVKAYHQEADSDKILKILPDFDGVFLSELTKVEFVSAIWKKVSSAEATEIEAREVIGFFEKDYIKYNWIIIDREIINTAINFVNKHRATGLRTLDSIQLACAISVKKETDLFLTSDKILKSIFIKENLKTNK